LHVHVRQKVVTFMPVAAQVRQAKSDVVANLEGFNRQSSLDVVATVAGRVRPGFAHLVEPERLQRGDVGLVVGVVVPVLMVVRDHPGGTAAEDAAERLPMLGIVIGDAFANLAWPERGGVKADVEIDLVAGQERDIRGVPRPLP